MKYLIKNKNELFLLVIVPMIFLYRMIFFGEIVTTNDELERHPINEWIENYIATNESGELRIRTYERGVENETLACGTGAVAAAIAADFWDLHCQKSPMIIKALGGTLKVGFVKTENGYEKIVLSGQAKFVFSGEIS